ncbi:hypothetical protein DXG03_004188, partial [Asterophora parasitica]
MGKGNTLDVSDIVNELRSDREERKKERKAMEETLKGMQVQFGKALSDRVKSLEKTFESYAENTNKSITVLAQLVNKLIDNQSSSLNAIPAMKTALVSSMTSEDVIRDKATRAVLIGFPEQETTEETDKEDLKLVSSLFRHMGDSHLLSIADK